MDEQNFSSTSNKYVLLTGNDMIVFKTFLETISETAYESGDDEVGKAHALGVCAGTAGLLLTLLKQKEIEA